MVFTRKFSQFVQGGVMQSPNMPVGLATGANTIWTYDGENGPGNGTIINQSTTVPIPLTVGMWMRINAAGLYTPALADNAQDAEVVGVITQIIDSEHFFIQQSGYIPTSANVFSGLTATIGSAYFLSAVTPGLMVPFDVQQNNLVSKPLFVLDSASSGWVLDYRGLIIGDEAIIIPNCPDTSIVTVIQNAHGFSVGNWVRLSGSINYVLAQANNFGNSQEVGVVINVLNVNQFQLQTSGYNIGAITKNDVGLAISVPNVYYLSQAVPGAISITNPSSPGSISRPVYIPEQVYGVTGVNAGYILNQRTLGVGSFNTGSTDFPMALLFGR